MSILCLCTKAEQKKKGERFPTWYMSIITPILVQFIGRNDVTKNLGVGKEYFAQFLPRLLSSVEFL